MMIRALLLLLAVLPMMGHAQVNLLEKLNLVKPRPQPQTIKVLVVHDKPGAVLEVKGKYKLFDPNTGEFMSTRFLGKRKYVQGLVDGLRWGEEFPGIYQILIVPDSMASTTVVDGIEYRGSMYVYDIGGGIGIVNEIDIEDYISSLLAQTALNDLSPETLNAVAIAERSLALYQSYNPKTTYWAVDAGDVGYQGAAVVHPANPIEKAIDITHGMVLSRSDSPIGTITPVMADWSQAKITLAQAEELAKKGEHAAQILTKAFPGTSIQMVQK